MITRCINFDWIEVYVLETGEPKTPEYFEANGFSGRVKLRDYGTPQYRQMFTLYNGKFPLIEVRREPYSIRTLGGIFDPRACHLRLSNRSCYLDDPIGFLLAFLARHKYKYMNTTRIDLCLDFNHFDNGDNPSNFLRDYFANRYTKVHQPRFAAHGVDEKAEKEWNSVKWGATTSSISTKLYNKSLELKQVGDKPYIRQRWEEAGLNPYSDVWRVEFAMKSEFKSLVRLDVDTDTGELSNNVLDIDIMTFSNREFVRFTFFALCDYYFDFRYVELNRNGFLKRKYLCKKKILFKVNSSEQSFTPRRLVDKPVGDRTDYMLIKRLKEICSDRLNYTPQERISAAAVIDGISRQIATRHMPTASSLQLKYDR